MSPYFFVSLIQLTPEEMEEQEVAAIKMQAAFRGRAVRKQLNDGGGVEVCVCVIFPHPDSVLC